MQRSQYTLQELAEKTGLTRRTIRYYIARGLVPAPDTAGRTAYYTDAHLEALNRVTSLKSQGYGLNDINKELHPADVNSITAERWILHRISSDVQIFVDADAPTWRLKRINEAAEELAAILSREEKREE